MMLLLKLVVLVIMLAGLVFTILPRVPGTLVILAGVLIYGLFTGFESFVPWVVMTLAVLVLTAEVGGRWLRVYLTKRYSLSRLFCASSTIGSIGGIVAADALLGPVVGVLLWELVAGKTLAPRWDTVSKVLLRLVAAAALRFGCGLLMIILAMVYILR